MNCFTWLTFKKTNLNNKNIEGFKIMMSMKHIITVCEKGPLGFCKHIFWARAGVFVQFSSSSFVQSHWDIYIHIYLHTCIHIYIYTVEPFSLTRSGSAGPLLKTLNLRLLLRDWPIPADARGKMLYCLLRHCLRCRIHFWPIQEIWCANQWGHTHVFCAYKTDFSSVCVWIFHDVWTACNQSERCCMYSSQHLNWVKTFNQSRSKTVNNTHSWLRTHLKK